MDSQLHVGYLTILYFMISGFFARARNCARMPEGQFKSLPGKFWHKCLRIYPVAIVGLRAAVFVVVVELLAIPLYLFVEKPLAKYMKKYEWQNLRPVDPL